MTVFRPDTRRSWLRRLHHGRRLAGRVDPSSGGEARCPADWDSVCFL